MPKESLTPMMKQFFDFKAKHPDALLLFRCGDFYETYGEDAVTAAKALGITLTRRNNGKNGTADLEMAGFPYHALDNYLPRLVRAGFRVAICDQLEDPKLTKTLVKRGITELVTPGVAMQQGVLAEKENNWLAAVHFGAATLGLSFLDLSTGEFLVSEGTPEAVKKLIDSFGPKEVLVKRGLKPRLQKLFGTTLYTYETDDWTFNAATAEKSLLTHFGVKTLRGFGVDHLHDGLAAAGAVLCYLELTQHTATRHISRISRIEEERYVRIDPFTVRNLELVAPMQPGGRTLLDVIDHTLTPPGGRMLRRWLLFPLRDVAAIKQRQDGVEQYFRHTSLREICEQELPRVGDLERLASKVSTARANPREMQQLRYSLESAARIKQVATGVPEESIKTQADRIDSLTELVQTLGRTLRLDPPVKITNGGYIADGVNQELDQLRQISTSSRDYLISIQEKEAARTGIASLKVGYSTTFGYYLEVRNTYKNLVPEEWVRKQTLVQAERYITQELKELEEKIIGADDRILALEADIYAKLLAYAAKFIPQIQRTAQAISTLDCYCSMAATAQALRYVRPVVDDTTEIDIAQGRHPVIETLMPPGEEYVANDVQLDTEQQQIIIVTGPNMSGKSALLRQTALITLLAQIGSYVPAAAARIGVVDKIFTRVGASDNISMGESTFMNEMTEAANIMNNLTMRSLVLFDELGRGTSTYDGISIAWAIVEHLHENPTAHARTLFATHYHELNEMENRFSRIKNYNVSVREADGRIIFLRRLARGGSEHSFGIHVAKLAGMPPAIVARAEQILRDLENQSRGGAGIGSEKLVPKEHADTQLNFFRLEDPVLEQIRDEFLGLDVNNLTPLEALNKLSDIKRIIAVDH
ncbi:MAG: DNA mismatch repair protein MutS [Bacteroidaceae bacterium]|nr:DNA mismatch repair protein MutS [Bacteroidaceae bacterium]